MFTYHFLKVPTTNKNNNLIKKKYLKLDRYTWKTYDLIYKDNRLYSYKNKVWYDIIININVTTITKTL